MVLVFIVFLVILLILLGLCFNMTTKYYNHEYYLSSFMMSKDEHALESLSIIPNKESQNARHFCRDCCNTIFELNKKKK